VELRHLDGAAVGSAVIRRVGSSGESWSWDAFFEHAGIEPVLVLYENFAADHETSTLNLLERLGLSPPDDFSFKPRMKKQSDSVNDDWTKRYSELRLGTEFDLVPVPSSK
jgi:LPS sulfotransferase NodH